MKALENLPLKSVLISASKALTLLLKELQSSLSSISQSHFKQFRFDKVITAEIIHISHVNFDLWPKLSPQAQSFLLEKTVQQIHTTFGDFYATEASVGGIFQQSVTMQMRASDDKLSLESSIQASFSSLAGSAAASLSGSASVDAKVENRKANVMLKVLGGKADVWLQLSGNNQLETQKKWANSVTPENMFPTGMRLVPLWSLLEHKNANFGKAAELQKYMKEQWAKSKSKIPKYTYAPEDPAHFQFALVTGDQTYMNGDYHWKPQQNLYCRGDQKMVIRRGVDGWDFCAATGCTVTIQCYGSRGRSGYLEEHEGRPAEGVVLDWGNEKDSSLAYMDDCKAR